MRSYNIRISDFSFTTTTAGEEGGFESFGFVSVRHMISFVSLGPASNSLLVPVSDSLWIELHHTLLVRTFCSVCMAWDWGGGITHLPAHWMGVGWFWLFISFSYGFLTNRRYQKWAASWILGWIYLVVWFRSFSLIHTFVSAFCLLLLLLLDIRFLLLFVFGSAGFVSVYSAKYIYHYCNCFVWFAITAFGIDFWTLLTLWRMYLLTYIP